MDDRALPERVLSRYPSAEMGRIFSAERRIGLWRDLWIALAEAQKELGLPIKSEQIRELKKYRDRINWEAAEKKEREIRHDVMAHVHAYGLQAKKAAGIIHLGATSAYVTDNADLIMMRDGLELLAGKTASAIDRLASFATKERSTATLAFTHFQPAQPTTVGKRACLWMQNFVLDLERIEFELNRFRFHGVKGATGTQDSFLKLFNGDKRKVLELDRRVTKKMGFQHSFAVTGQTYPRKADTAVVSALAGICESASKFAVDVRLLQGMHEVEEPREEAQVGSSAMPYKHNPMRSERIGSLSRYVMNLVGNDYDTAATQWFERSLDDSANRRLVLPHAFLVTDGVLALVNNVAAGLHVRRAVVAQHLEQELPFLQTEEILMAAVQKGGNRQALHEKMRRHSEEVIRNVRERGQRNDLLTRLRNDPAFGKVPPKLIVRSNPLQLVGLAPEQVTSFVRQVVMPIRRRYKSALRTKAEIRV